MRVWSITTGRGDQKGRSSSSQTHARGFLSPAAGVFIGGRARWLTPALHFWGATFQPPLPGAASRQQLFHVPTALRIAVSRRPNSATIRLTHGDGAPWPQKRKDRASGEGLLLPARTATSLRHGTRADRDLAAAGVWRGGRFFDAARARTACATAMGSARVSSSATPAGTRPGPSRRSPPGPSPRARPPLSRAQLANAAASADAVLLHYVGYGYAHRGCPFWLVDGLERWKRAAGSTSRLIVIFPRNVRVRPAVVERVLDEPVPAAAGGATWPGSRMPGASPRRAGLHELTGTLRRGENLPATVAPVFSNVGEPARPAPGGRPRVAGRRFRQPSGARAGVRPARRAGGVLRAARDHARRGCRRAAAGNGPRLDGVDSPREAGPLPAPEASALFRAIASRVFRLQRPFFG